MLLLAVLTDTDDEEGMPAAPIEVPLPVTGPAMPNSKPADGQEIEALSRVIASEAGGGTLAEQRAVGWTVRNRFAGKSIYAVEYPWRAQKGSDPPFSSARPATGATRKLAQEILSADQSEDPTNGATAFFEPKMQDVFAQAGAMARAGQTGDRVIDGVKLTDITRFKAYRKTAADIRASWGKGSSLYAKAGRFEFWGSTSKLIARGNPAPREILAGSGEIKLASGKKFTDIVDPLDVVRKQRGQG